jgi:hypothetical protein
MLNLDRNARLGEGDRMSGKGLKNEHSNKEKK